MLVQLEGEMDPLTIALKELKVQLSTFDPLAVCLSCWLFLACSWLVLDGG